MSKSRPGIWTSRLGIVYLEEFDNQRMPFRAQNGSAETKQHPIEACAGPGIGPPRLLPAVGFDFWCLRFSFGDSTDPSSTRNVLRSPILRNRAVVHPFHTATLKVLATLGTPASFTANNIQ
ncbi:hypothetical protein JMJ77_0010173 [Colletotrichum scovillei]|uniref:Uncharacterized protein n=1 Tax=Colletotrichum scovillei TaxID=1209932 RepID=A0A9P7QV55_9PEZI|nr:hypothetical protein JMJ78_0011552 [Colletotrichum scovillei]KAG7042067.1 hypothetical protein JMJ77_0010173 [Colletotrichum scovillei]KAG7062098.1 hypothetical protein JMJ76_0006380 [Colletotrichum scovillei]